MKYKTKGNFRIDSNGNIEYYVGWCSVEEKDLDNLKKILKEHDSRQ